MKTFTGMMSIYTSSSQLVLVLPIAAWIGTTIGIHFDYICPKAKVNKPLVCIRQKGFLTSQHTMPFPVEAELKE